MSLLSFQKSYRVWGCATYIQKFMREEDRFDSSTAGGVLRAQTTYSFSC
jgi:hypothetical protein